MQHGIRSSQIRAIAMAFLGAVVAAVAIMFVPVSILDSIIGSTGVAELLPAARAPLGDTARALIAFGVGAVTLAALAFVLLRNDDTQAAHAAWVEPDWADDEAPSIQDRLSRFRVPSIALPIMPWKKGDDDITELSDLPKLRNGDIHPDAPPRRPLSAQQDLPVLDSAVVETLIAQDPVAEADVEIEHRSIEDIEFAAGDIVPLPAHELQPTLAEMVAQLEAAVAERQKQLAELEAVATHLGARYEAEDVSPEPMETAPPARAERPPLEAVPASARDDDMDSALAAALATLHRMNGTDR